MKKALLVFFTIIAFVSNAQLIDKSELETDDEGNYYELDIYQKIPYAYLTVLLGEKFAGNFSENMFDEYSFYFKQANKIKSDTLIQFQQSFHLEVEEGNPIPGRDYINILVSHGLYTELGFITHNKAEFDRLMYLVKKSDGSQVFAKYYTNSYGKEFYCSARVNNVEILTFTGQDTIDHKVVIPKYVITAQLKPGLPELADYIHIFKANDPLYAINTIEKFGYKYDKRTALPDSQTIVYTCKSIVNKSDHVHSFEYPYVFTIYWDKTNQKITGVNFYTYSEEEHNAMVQDYKDYADFVTSGSKTESYGTVYTYTSKSYPNLGLEELRKDIDGKTGKYTSHTYRIMPK